jgi:hypothetical protein
LRRRREARAVHGRRDAVGSREASGERTHALQTDREADVSDRAIGRPQQRGCALQAPGQKVRVRRLAEGTPELAAKMGAREASGSCEILDGQRLEVTTVRHILGAEQMAGRRDEGHLASISPTNPDGLFALVSLGTPLWQRSLRPKRSADVDCRRHANEVLVGAETTKRPITLNRTGRRLLKQFTSLRSGTP